VSLLSSVKATEIYCIESPPPPGNPIISAVLGDMMKGTPLQRNLIHILTVDLALGCKQRKMKSNERIDQSG
jgi:hypothetical protein